MFLRCASLLRTHRANAANAANAAARAPRRGGTSRPRLLAAASVLSLGTAGTVFFWPPDLQLVARLHTAAGDHLDQRTLLALVQQGRDHDAFERAFEHGDEMFETTFNALDGVGAHVGDGQRFTRVPRADLARPGQWAAHVPSRATGPNAASCNACHNNPGDDGAGGAANNAIRDPLHTGNVGRMIQRNTPHLFGAGAIQRLAEEMAVDLQLQKDQLEQQVRQTGRGAGVALASKGVGFGTLRARPAPFRPGRVQFDFGQVRGLDDDLVVRPFQWKGSVASLRDFNRGAAHNELGLQAVELVGAANDGDDDGVVDELSIGDATAFAIYVAAQPRPTTRIELATLGLIPALAPAELDAIGRGGQVFTAVGCAECHRPMLVLQDPIFREPSAVPSFRDMRFPAHQLPVAEGVDPQFPVRFDLTLDQPDNVIQQGGQTVHLGSFVPLAGGGVAVELFGDLRRHRMGFQLAENIDETGSGAATFLTENLWGVGSTAPYLHDGRATTLTEAILAHGGEADGSRTAFVALPTSAQQDLIAFLDNLVLFKAP